MASLFLPFLWIAAEFAGHLAGARTHSTAVVCGSEYGWVSIIDLRLVYAAVAYDQQ